MSEDLSLEEDLLTCTICKEIFNDPCTLECEHSFCRNCLTAFVKTKYASIDEGTLPCAICRHNTPVPHPNKAIERWAWQMNSNLILRNLMERQRQRSQLKKGQDGCYLCNQVGEVTLAISWCSDCEVTLCRRCAKRHQVGPSTCTHDLFDLSEGEHVKQRTKSKCKVHIGEKLQFVCLDCSDLLCQRCCILEHNKHTIVTVKSMLPDMKATLWQKREDLQKRREGNEETVKKEAARRNRLTSIKRKTASKIHSTIDCAIAFLREKEREFLHKLDQVSDVEISRQRDVVKNGQAITQTLDSHIGQIGRTLESESELHIYEMFKFSQSGALEHIGGSESEALTPSNLREIKFTPNLQPFREVIRDLGSLAVTVYPSQVTEDVNRPVHVVLHNSINIKMKEDMDRAEPSDIAVFTVDDKDVVVVADWRNRCLKSFYTVDDKVIRTSRLVLDNRPLRVAPMNGNRVVVTTFNCQILVVGATPDLTIYYSFNTSKQYKGITALGDGTLAASSTAPPSVDIIDLSGHVHRSIGPHTTGLTLIHCPSYLRTTHDYHILVADSASKSLYCLTSDGGVVFAYRPTGHSALRHPGGVAVGEDGDVFVTDWGSVKITQLGADGMHVRDVIAPNFGIDEPGAIAQGSSGRFYVVDRSSPLAGIKVLAVKSSVH